MKELRWFTAKYDGGYCRACNTGIDIDDLIAFNEENNLVGKRCCKGQGIDEFESVMPTGKTKENRCEECFMVHSNGQEDCE